MRVFFIILCGLILNACFFLGPTPKKRLNSLKQQESIDVAVVPGLPLYHGKWDTLLKARILWSEFLFKKGYVKNILYSGNAVYSPWQEGPSMALYAKQLDIPEQHILIDTLAEHSTENLFYGYLLAKQKGYKTIAVATDPFQCALLQKFARKHFKEEVIFIPIVYDSIRGRSAIELEIDTTLTKKSGFIPLNERQNYKDRLKGTRGKNIRGN